MNPLRIAHISDTHLGYRSLPKADPVTSRNQRALDVERAYRAVVDDILTRDVDLVIHSGDVFHQSRPSWAAMRCFIRQTRRLEDAGLPVIVVTGNHDTPRLRTAGSVFSVLDLALPKTKFAVGYEHQVFPFDHLDLLVTAVPHGSLTNPVQPFIFPDPGTRNVLAIHGAITNSDLIPAYREAGETFIGDALLDATFDYIAFGHIHQHVRATPNGWYAGAIERFAWDDAEITPGYALVTLNGRGEPPAVTHVPLPVRPFYRIDRFDGAGLSARDIVDAVISRLRVDATTDAMVRVQLLNSPRPVRREAESLLRRETAGLVWWIEVTSPKDIAAGFERRTGGGPATDIVSLFDEFVQAGEYDDAFAGAFRDRGRQALEDALQDAETTGGPEDAAA